MPLRVSFIGLGQVGGKLAGSLVEADGFPAELTDDRPRVEGAEVPRKATAE